MRNVFPAPPLPNPDTMPTFDALADLWVKAMHDIERRFPQHVAVEMKKSPVHLAPVPLSLARPLQQALKDEGLPLGLSRLRVMDKRGMAFVGHAAWQLFQGARRTAVGGLLGGIGLPITRFLATNYLTAPFIVAATTGGREGLEAARDMARVGWIRAALRKAGSVAPDEVVFTDIYGKAWTRGELEAAEHINPIQGSQASYEFGDAVMNEVIRATRLVQHDGASLWDRAAKLIGRSDKEAGRWLREAGTPRQFWRWMRPWDMNYWSRIGWDSDVYFRRGVFYRAIRDGKTPREAAKLASASMLDYGEKLPDVLKAGHAGGVSPIPKWEREGLGRMTLFYVFTRQMLAAAIHALATHPSDTARILAAHYWLNNYANQWATMPDYARTKLYTIVSKKYPGGPGSGPTLLGGPSEPLVESVNKLIDLAEWGKRMVTPGQVGEALGEARSAIPDLIFTPEYDFFQQLKTRGGSKVIDPYMVWALQRSGLWPWALGAFDLRPVNPGDPGFKEDHPTVFKQQWKTARWNQWAAFQYVLMVAGLQREIRDYTAATVHAYPSSGFNWKGKGTGGIGGALAYGVALNSPVTLPPELEVRKRALDAIKRRLKGDVTDVDVLQSTSKQE